MNFAKFLPFILVFCLPGKEAGELPITLAMMDYYELINKYNQLLTIMSDKCWLRNRF